MLELDTDFLDAADGAQGTRPGGAEQLGFAHDVHAAVRVDGSAPVHRWRQTVLWPLSAPIQGSKPKPKLAWPKQMPQANPSQ